MPDEEKPSDPDPRPLRLVSSNPEPEPPLHQGASGEEPNDNDKKLRLLEPPKSHFLRPEDPLSLEDWLALASLRQLQGTQEKQLPRSDPGAVLRKRPAEAKPEVSRLVFRRLNPLTAEHLEDPRNYTGCWEMVRLHAARVPTPEEEAEEHARRERFEEECRLERERSLASEAARAAAQEGIKPSTPDAEDPAPEFHTPADDDDEDDLLVSALPADPLTPVPRKAVENPNTTSGLITAFGVFWVIMLLLEQFRHLSH